MSDKEVEKSIAEEIDADEGLKSKRKLLTISSLVLLALSFSSARVEEANTFLVKLKFDNQDGLGILLVLGVLFLFIRYFNYASKYHQKLFKAWSDRLLRDDYCSIKHPFENEGTGLTFELLPKKSIAIDEERGELVNWTVSYESNWLVVKKIKYKWFDEYDKNNKSIRIGWPHYPKVLLLETKYRFFSFITYREHLDIFAPYLLGGLAILSFFFHDSFQVLINAISAYRQ